MHEWCVRRNKGLSKNRFKIDISIKVLGHSVKLNVRKKKQWASEKCYSFAAVGFGKKSGALRWLRQNLRLSRKCVRWKAIFFGPEGMIGKGALGKWRAFSGATSWTVLRRRVRLGWSIQRLLGSRGVTQPARFQGSTRFCEAAHCHWSRLWTTNL